jgi:3-deoxy-D-arabino-heptulosonate 7-phosphate (DAHP) synthase class II
MRGEGKESGRKTYRVDVVRGEPYHVGDRELIPEARIASYGRARATIGTHRTGGWGVGLVQVKPLAIVERTAEGERRIVISDATARSMRLMLGVAAAMMVIFAGIRWLVRRRRGASIEG